MGRIPDDIIQRIRDRVDMVDLVGRFVTLKKNGRNFVGLCPFHDEKTPSFNVTPERQSFHCFGCEEGGNPFTFLMKIENLSFPEAVRVLGREAGVEVPETGGADGGLSEKLFTLLEFAQKHFCECLEAPGNPGAAYLEDRGIDAASIERHGIGFAPESWDTLAKQLRASGHSEATAARAGLLAERERGGYYDRLRGRVTFPIRDVRGRVVAFGGRMIGKDDGAKYLNTPESPVFRKRESFFGFPRALEPIRRTQQAVVVEGYFDQIALDRAGIEGAVATCGTALTDDHARELHRRTQTVVLMFDGDEAGQKAIERSLEVLLPAGLRVEAALLPPGEDPDDFLRREGAEALSELVAEATSAVDLAIRRAVARGRSTPAEKSDAVASVAPTIALVSSAVERADYVSRLAMSVEVDQEHVAAAIRAAARGADPRDAVPITPRRKTPEQRVLYQMARALVEHPHLGEKITSGEFATLVSSDPLIDVITALLDAAGQGPSIVEGLADSFEGKSRELLHALIAEGEGLDEAAAARTIDDTLRWLETGRQKAEQQALTRQMRESSDEAMTLLKEKERLRRTSSGGVLPGGRAGHTAGPPDPGPHGPSGRMETPR
ncbi:MAG: DNA primase [Myxococcales bacterium]|nr:DNA primase [Myxococcales bacterium]